MKDRKKQILDLRITRAEEVGAQCVWLKAKPVEGHLPVCSPGQFAQLRVDAPDVFLRRPISIHDVEGDEISFLVQMVGEGTQWLGALKTGDTLNAVLPLGRGFTVQTGNEAALLVGGGVGVAPLLYLGKQLKANGIRPVYLLGARTEGLLLRLDAFQEVGEVFVTTEDGSMGEKGFVTQHSVLSCDESGKMETLPARVMLYTCGPKPMMNAVARLARERNLPCEVSLENRMACGVGACLCCVEETADGHNRCVCTEGPVFDALELKI